MEIESKAPPIVKCPICRRYFLDADFSGLCPACEPQNEWRIKPKTCPVCGKEFMAVRGTQVYCSRECHTQAYIRKKHAEALERQKIQKEPKECPYCHKVFAPRHPLQKYCNPKCSKRMNSLAFRDKQPKTKHSGPPVRILPPEDVQHTPTPAPRACLKIAVAKMRKPPLVATKDRKNYMTDSERKAAIHDIEQKKMADW